MTIVKAEEIVKNIKNLPPLPLVVQQLMKVVGDANTSAKDVAEVLSSDQAMTSKVLRLVNSAFYGLPGKISTISRAVVILGNAAVRNLALAFASYDALKKIGGERIQERFWGHALTCAVGAQEMALHLKHQEAEEAFTAGLLHDLGHLILITFLPNEYTAVYSTVDSDFLEREEQIMGTTHTEVGSLLLKHWQIPDNLCRIVRLHHTDKLGIPGKEPLLCSVMLADILSCVKASHFREFPDPDLFIRITEDAGISWDDYGSILTKMDAKIRDARLSLGIKVTATSDEVVSSKDKRATILIIGDDEDRIKWVKGLVESFGNQVKICDLSEHGEPDLDGAHLAIFDPVGRSVEEIKTLRMQLMVKDIPHAALASKSDRTTNDHARLVGYPMLPFIFTHEHLRRLLKEVAQR